MAKIDNIINTAKVGFKGVKEVSSKKIQQYIRDKAYKEAVKEAVKEGVDITNMSPNDVEYLVNDKEKEIKKKIENMTWVGIATYLGYEIGGL